jgi:L-iditol 2-dehydrogenase
VKALVYEGAWQMPLRQVETPQIQSPDDVVIAVKAVGVCGSDVHGFRGTTGRRKPPIIMGHEFSGTVTAIGSNVSDKQVGDRVVVNPILACGKCDNCLAGLPNICFNRSGLGVNLNGAYADAVRVQQKMVYTLPKDVTWEQGTLVEPLAVAMHAVNLTPFRLLDTVVVIGAGTIGLLTLAAAKLRGAGELIITDVSPHRLEVARRLGADYTVNVAEQDPVAVVQERTRGLGAAAVIEAVGITATVKQSLVLVRNGGHVTWIGNSDPEVQINMQQIVTREITVAGAYGFNQEFGQSIEMIRSHKIDPMLLVERRAALEQGTQIIDELAKGKLDLVKVILKPNSQND